MTTFHPDRHALKFTTDAVARLQIAFKLPDDICLAHIRAMEIGRGMREQLRHATEGLRLIRETSMEDPVQQQMVTALQRSLEAVATDLSIRLYEEMPKTPVAWADAVKIVTQIFDRELGPGFVTPNKLQGFESDSAVVADRLLSADAKGHFSHGVERIIRYILLMCQGRLNPNGACTLDPEASAHMGSFDGACTFGQVGMQWGFERALEKVEERGSYLTAGYNMGHVGMLVHTLEEAVRRNLFAIGMLNTNGGRGALDMNGTESLLGTNPVGMGVPDGDEGVFIDMSAMKLTEGGVNVMLQLGLQAPVGVMREADGTSTTDPPRLYGKPHALLMPMGEHKGVAMGIMADITTAAFTGKGRTGVGERKTSPNSVNNGWLALFRIEGKEHHDLIKAYAEMVANVEVMKGTQRRGVLPGVRGHRAEMKARAGNVEIPTEIWNTVTEFHKTNELPDVKM